MNSHIAKQECDSHLNHWFRGSLDETHFIFKSSFLLLFLATTKIKRLVAVWNKHVFHQCVLDFEIFSNKILLYIFREQESTKNISNNTQFPSISSCFLLRIKTRLIFEIVMINLRESLGSSDWTEKNVAAAAEIWLNQSWFRGKCRLTSPAQHSLYEF